MELATGITDAVTDKSPGDVGLFVPFPFIETVQKIAGDKLVVGAEVGTAQVLAGCRDTLLDPSSSPKLTHCEIILSGDHPRNGWCLYWRYFRSYAQVNGH